MNNSVKHWLNKHTKTIFITQKDDIFKRRHKNYLKHRVGYGVGGSHRLPHTDQVFLKKICFDNFKIFSLEK